MSDISAKLLRYVEPVAYNGKFKTAFYSEWGTDYKIGDKVFIINGNYDTNNLIISSTFSSINIDGYKIIDINKCRIVLDIDYTGTSVYNSDSIDNYVKLHTVNSQHQFDYINAINSNTYGTYSSKFEWKLSNDVIYTNLTYSGTNSVFGYNNGITSSGFFQKDSSTNNWINISSTFSHGLIDFKTTGSYPTYSLTYNNKVLVIGENLTYSTTSFKQRNIYSYDSSKGWIIDITSTPAYITKRNFRNGSFNGSWNDGVFGSYDNIANWDNQNATWNSGILLNSSWKTGILNSRNSPITNTNYVNSLYEPSFVTPITTTYSILQFNNLTASRTIDYNNPVKQINNTLTPSYYSKLDNGVPIQSSDYSNNKGFGFNYIIDSNIEAGDIINGNFENCNIGLTNYGINSIDVYYGPSFTYSIQISGGNYTLCDINTAAFKNSNIVNSNIINSNINNSKLSNNQIDNTVANGEYDADNSINIINADLWSYIPAGSTQKRGVLKLFIDSNDINKITDFETIYIDNINKDVSLLKDDDKVHLNIENKYILDHFFNSEITSTTGSILVSTKMASDNIYKSYIYYSGSNYTNNYSINTNKYASLDIDLSETLAWYTDGTSSYYVNNNPTITTDNVSKLFTGTNIINSNFNSGLLINSEWKNGNNYNDISNRVLNSGGSYSIKIPTGSTNSLKIDISDTTYNKYYDLNIGDYIWLNGLDYATNSISGSVSSILNNSTFKISATATVTLPNSRSFILTEITNNIYNNSMTASGRFFVNGLMPNYFSINQFKIDKTNIISGDFKSTLIVNSTILNNEFNNSDKTLTLGNINKLKFINILFKDDNNTINSGLVYNSHILNTTWNNGISFNSIFKGVTFSNGIIKNSYWIDGTFNNGMFIDSSAIISVTSSFELLPHYRSWRNGTFNNGQFYSSIWIDGTFNNGKFYNSHWYGGVFNNGIVGAKNLQYYNTTVGHYANIGTGSTSTTWNYGTVENAIIGGSSSVYWNDGVFNNGEFTNGGGLYSSIWYKGMFNGGKFTLNAKWIDGVFNNGKFLSSYGYTMSNSTQSSDYSWENGKFNGGQFGQPSFGTNSTWFNGEFNGGSFYGIVWNYGIFTKGDFYGSSLTSSYKNEQNFVNSFTHSYYGLWRDGYVVDSINLGNPNQKIHTTAKRATDTKKIVNTVNLNNALWLNGTFSHPNGVADNIVWLNGSFLKGHFNNSSFNPFVDRTLSGSTVSASQSFCFDDSCKWFNGTFNNGAFYISEWRDGSFLNGYMLGGIWRNGIWYYGTAENCYWDGGTWKNGNWRGTNFDYTTLGTSSQYVADLKTKYVLYNIANVLGTSSIHLLNAMTGSVSDEILYDPNFDEEADMSPDYHGWTQSGSQPWTWSPTYEYDHIVFGGSVVGSSITKNNYQTNLTSMQSNTIFGMSQSGAGWTNTIFIPNKAYDISLQMHVNYPVGYTTYPTSVNILLGYTTSIVQCLHGLNNFNFHLDADASLWSAGLTDSRLGITKLTSVDAVTTALLNISVTLIDIGYDFAHNNSQWIPYVSTVTISATASMPPIIYTTMADNGLVSILYGNGKFKKGIWENGVFNNGWRDDDTLTRCSVSMTSPYIKMSANIHRIQLLFLDQNQSLFNVGDSVSVGNITSIDINNKRRLIKDAFKVVSIGTTNIVLEITLNYPIHEIVQDSDLHLIYLSKNIWLSGSFLNGYFNGIWNYGLFKGFPYITYMKNSHFIDGIFDGGHFLSTTSSGPSGSLISQYNTGLVQNFEFKDNNIADAYHFKYDSWMDINYVLDAQTNIYQEQNIYSDIIYGTSGQYHGVISKANFNGAITYDILSSKSNFRDGYDTIIKTYNLGTKYTKYVDYLDQIGDFNHLFSNRYTSLGMNNFFNDGWTYSSLINGIYGTSIYSNTILDPSKFSLLDEDTTFNFISVTYATSATDSSISIFPTSARQHYFLLDNTNTLNIPNKRYSMYEYELLSFTGWIGPAPYSTESYAYNPGFFNPAISSLIFPATWSTTKLVINPFWNNSNIKHEYFYNRHGLEMLFTSGSSGIITPPLALQFANIHFYEIDMIPFFSYLSVTSSHNRADENYVDHDIRLPNNIIATNMDNSNPNLFVI